MANFSFVFFLLMVFISCHHAYKIIIFVPGLSNSQLLFNYRFGDLLASHGHNVTLYVAQYNSHVKISKPKYAKEFIFPAAMDEKMIDRFYEDWEASIFVKDESVMEIIKDISAFYENIYVKGCELQLTDENLMKQLKNEQFDIALAHNYDLCPMGMIAALEIPTYVWMSSGVFMEHIAWAVGSPAPASYAPNFLSSFSDRMTFVERMKNFFGVAILQIFYDRIVVQPQQDIFNRHFGPQFPSIYQLARKSPLVFINSEELIDFPRPILHKTIYIGGISMNKPEKLDEKWKKIVDESDLGVVVLSFGSVVRSSAMPSAWRESFVNAFSKFPRYTFIWKFEKEVPEAANHKNIIIDKWVPQKDLLAMSKTKVLITHCGYNSFLESVTIGVPTIGIPLFGDQYTNMKKGERLGVTIGIDKKNFNADVLQEALNRVLTNTSFRDNAMTTAKLLSTKPIKSEDLVLRWIDFLGEFKELPNLEPSSIDLSLAEYFMIDVIFTLIFAIILSTYVTFCTTRYLCRLLFCRQKFKHRRNRLGYSFSE